MTRPGAPALVFEDVYGAGSAASLSGPYKVSANYIFAGRPQELRFSTSASDPDGVFRLKSALRDPDRNTTYLLEGDVTGFKEKPSFDGAVIMRIASALPPEGAQQGEGQARAVAAGQRRAADPASRVPAPKRIFPPSSSRASSTPRRTAPSFRSSRLPFTPRAARR